jgi:hypothetical protein
MKHVLALAEGMCGYIEYLSSKRLECRYENLAGVIFCLLSSNLLTVSLSACLCVHTIILPSIITAIYHTAIYHYCHLPYYTIYHLPYYTIYHTTIYHTIPSTIYHTIPSTIYHTIPSTILPYYHTTILPSTILPSTIYHTTSVPSWGTYKRPTTGMLSAPRN